MGRNAVISSTVTPRTWASLFISGCFEGTCPQFPISSNYPSRPTASFLSCFAPLSLVSRILKMLGFCSPDTSTHFRFYERNSAWSAIPAPISSISHVGEIFLPFAGMAGPIFSGTVASTAYGRWQCIASFIQSPCTVAGRTVSFLALHYILPISPFQPCHGRKRFYRFSDKNFHLPLIGPT